MTKEEQQKARNKVKKAFKLTELRPFMFNDTLNEYGLLQINEYSVKGLKRTHISPNNNANVEYNRWYNNNKDQVIQDVLQDGNDARKPKDVGICLIEVIDANFLTLEEFNELYDKCKSTTFAIENLYKSIKDAILKEITKSKTTLYAWSCLEHVFGDRIGLEIWQGDLQCHKILTGETSQEKGLREIIKHLLEDNKATI